MGRKLVAYFSATGTTKSVAETLAKAVEADLYEICPAIPYTDADLDWTNKKSRSSVEMQDISFRPAIMNGQDAGVESYDTIFVGFPIWWYVAPTIINTFLESYDFSGKTIILFATSGGSGFGRTADNLKESVSSDTKIIEGKLWNQGCNVNILKEWVESLNI